MVAKGQMSGRLGRVVVGVSLGHVAEVAAGRHELGGARNPEVITQVPTASFALGTSRLLTSKGFHRVPPVPTEIPETQIPIVPFLNRERSPPSDSGPRAGPGSWFPPDQIRDVTADLDHPGGSDPTTLIHKTKHPLIISHQISLQDRLVVGDPVPQFPENLEVQVYPVTQRRDRHSGIQVGEYVVEVGNPEAQVVALGHQVLPEDELQFGNDLAGRPKTAPGADHLLSLAPLPQRIWETSLETRRPGPGTSIDLLNGLGDGVSHHDFADVKRGQESCGNPCVPSIKVQGGQALVTLGGRSDLEGCQTGGRKGFPDSVDDELSCHAGHFPERD